jgi:S-adenosyl methyltransferase
LWKAFGPHDPIVLSHAQALLTSTREGACAYIDADLRDAATILKQAAATLDLSRPVAVCLIMVQLHRWRPGSGVDTTRPLAAYGGPARKP